LNHTFHTGIERYLINAVQKLDHNLRSCIADISNSGALLRYVYSDGYFEEESET